MSTTESANADCLQQLVSWRNLDPGEIIQEGDEWWDWKDEVWRPAESTFGRSAHGHGDYRRKTTEQQPPANAPHKQRGDKFMTNKLHLIPAQGDTPRLLHAVVSRRI